MKLQIFATVLTLDGQEVNAKHPCVSIPVSMDFATVQILVNAQVTLEELIVRQHFALHPAKTLESVNLEVATEQQTSATALLQLDGQDQVATLLCVHFLVKMVENALVQINAIVVVLDMQDLNVLKKLTNVLEPPDLVPQSQFVPTPRATSLVLHVHQDTMELDMEQLDALI